MRNAAFGLALTAAVAAAGIAPAQARIVCNDGWQVVGGSEISTPYCRDLKLARLARGHGIRVSDNEVLNNPGTKREVCRFLNSNIEAQSACDESGSRRSSD